MWVYYDDWDIEGTQKFISNTEAEGNAAGGDNMQNNNGTLKFVAAHYWGFQTVSYDASLLSPGWHHITGTTDGYTLKIYVDAQFKNSFDVPAYYKYKTFKYANSLILGAEAGIDDTPTGSFFSGKMDEVRIWNSCRTEQQIKENMFINLTGVPAELIAYFQFNNSSGSTLADRVNGGGGILMGMADDDWVSSGVPISIYWPSENVTDTIFKPASIAA